MGLSLKMGLGMNASLGGASNTLPDPPGGFFYLVDTDGAFIVDSDGAYLLTQ